MDSHFKSLIDTLAPSFELLIAMEAVKVASLPRLMPERGIYLFSERGRHLYVGRSNNLRRRLHEHCRPNSTRNSAPFAFRLARKATGKKTASYTARDSRSDLERDPAFQTAFRKAKNRIRRMDVRYVGENDPLRQTLLEIYAAVALSTPHNDFDTH